MTPQRDEALHSLRLADHDIAAFEALLQHPEVHPAMACFHAQQAIEKSRKAVLFSRSVEFRRTHDLLELANLLKRLDPDFLKVAQVLEPIRGGLPLRRDGAPRAGHSGFGRGRQSDARMGGS